MKLMKSANYQDSGTIPDLSVCDREPIHIPGSIEPNGVLLALSEPELTITQVSANCEALLQLGADVLLGMPLSDLLEQRTFEAIRQSISTDNLDKKRRYVSGVRLKTPDMTFDGLVHRHRGVLMIELEPSSDESTSGSQPDVYEALTDAVADFNGELSLSELCQRVASHIRRLTGFDRVMVYRFLADDTGSVIAEDIRAGLDPYLGLRYPASDIPAQARRLYLLNTLRLKADVHAAQVPVVPVVNPCTGELLDMTYCVLRAMSPVHVEYLRNMGVSASMSISIVEGERLWGLIACHHTSAKTVPHRVRMSCEVLARIFSARIAAAEAEDSRHHFLDTRSYRNEIAEGLRGRPDILTALREQGDRLASIINSAGIAISLGGDLALIGNTPPREGVQKLVAWLAAHQTEQVFATDKLTNDYPAADSFGGSGSGLLSARITSDSSEFVLWFRPASVQVIRWAGNPSKPVEETEQGRRISPRLSFETWKETVRDRSEPWQDHEREFALTLRQVIAEALLVQRSKDVLRLNTELERSNIELDAFAYAASHDLQEPVRTIRSYAQLLVRRGGATLDENSKEFIKVIENGASRMGSLIAALLSYGQVGGNHQRDRKPVNLEDTLHWVLMNLDEAVRTSGFSITHDRLPTIQADPDQMVQLFQNLVGNSIKYRNPGEAPSVHVSAELKDQMWLIGLHDNGQGFEPEQAQVIFRAFKRLHGRDVPGTGIGLALCTRIVEYYGGRIWAESKGKGLGATVWFTLPQ